MKKFSKTILLSTFIFLTSCHKQNNKNVNIKVDTLVTKNEKERVPSSSPTSQIINYEKENEENEHDEFISNFLFQKWKGTYKLRQENQTDSWGRESVSFSELILIKPDSCVFKSWLADEDGKRYKEDDNYQEYVGGIYATANKDSIEFYTKKILSGGNNSLSPLLSLKRNNKDYFIYSLITSPPHNGIVEIAIKKIK